MSDHKIRRGNVSFQTEGRLLQELGERLVAKADVALVELIKNAYDADASECRVKFDGQRVEILDNGHGMTEQDFINNWMHIATAGRQRDRQSRQYRRTVTGSKGIGRFAVRFLGRQLRLETVASDLVENGEKTLLSITFDWGHIDAATQLNSVKIPYEIRAVSPDVHTGTHLVIEKLRDPKADYFNKSMRTELLSIVDPYSGLDAGKFSRRGKSEKDPGFRVILPGDSGEDEKDLAGAVLRNSPMRLTIEHKNSKTKYLVRHKDSRTMLRRTINYPSYISKGFFADIHYCPRRSGTFRNTGVDGRVLYGWLKDHGGIGVVDHGFRIRPYGFQDDDWLNVGLDSGHNRRDWRTEIMNELYPMPAKASSQPKLNPMLYLPSFHQLIGAVFLESFQEVSSERPTDLTPSMDREGYVDNEAYRDLVNLVRAGLEMLAFADHREQRRIEKEKKNREVQELRSDLSAAVAYVERIPGLSDHDREEVATRFKTLSKQLEEVEDYYQVSTTKLEMMGLLGVMAGFLTHEMKRLLNRLDRLLIRVKKIAQGDAETTSLLADIESTRTEIIGQLDYSTSYIGSLQSTRVKPVSLNVKHTVDHVIQQFKLFTKDRHVKIKTEIDDQLMSPPLPIALYSGIVMNLFTNALKAVLGGAEADSQPCVAIKSWNEPKWHVLEVADTGVGIPPTLRNRIWDPLFTTTSAGDYNPLGSGMGLGLSLVKTLISDIHGQIDLVPPPPGFRTCFRIRFLRSDGGK